MNRLSVRGKGEKISSKREPVHRLNRKQKIAQGVTFAVHKLSTGWRFESEKIREGTSSALFSLSSAKNLLRIILSPSEHKWK